MKFSAYLYFCGKAFDALFFYKSIFGGEISKIVYFADSAKNTEFKNEANRKILHASLRVGEQFLMVADIPSKKKNTPNNFSICIQTESKEETDQIFFALAKNGKLKQNLQWDSWGSYFGELIDKYQVRWLVNYYPKNPKKKFGELVTNWQGCPIPSKKILTGKYCELRILDIERDVESLFKNFLLENSSWDFLPYGPFLDFSSFKKWLEKDCRTQDPFFYTVFNKKNNALGMASYLRINSEMGVIEVGHLHFSKLLQNTTAATEAMYLMMRYAFDDLGYRRYEWKCNNLNQNSKKAALRLGFCFEGIFRQSAIYKGRNRDTAWYSIIDKEWPIIKKRFESWLNANNFDEAGKQKKRLQDF